jgi:hypothetical protein
MLQDPHFAAEIVHVPRTGPDYVSPVVPVTWFGEVAKWVPAWTALIAFTGDLPTTLSALKALRSAQQKLAVRQVQSHLGDVM